MSSARIMINGIEYTIIEPGIKLTLDDPFPWRIVQKYPGHGDLTDLEREVAEQLNVGFDAFAPGWPLGYKSCDHAWEVAAEMMKRRPELELTATNHQYEPLAR